MLHRTRTRAGESLLEAILEGDVLFFRSEETGGAGRDGGGGSSQEDDDSADDDDDSQDEDDDVDGGNSDDDDDDDEAEADARVRRANRQAAKLRVQLKEANERLAKLEANSSKPDGDDVEAEKVAKQMKDAEERAARAEARLLAIERERVVTKVATDLGFADPDVVFALAQAGRIEDLDTDDDEPWDRRDVKIALKALKKAKPHLLKDTDNESSNNGGDGGRSHGTTPTRKTRASEDLDKLPIGQRAHARLARAFSK